MTTTRPNLGPLTTPFTYPASCTLNIIQCSYCLVAWQAQTCSNNPNNAAGVQDNADCWPPRAATGSFGITTGVALNGWGVYSPGLSCPVGYNTACSATGTVNSGFEFQFPPSANETAIGCCPPSYTCTWEGKGAGQTCFSMASTGSFSAVQCSSGTSNAFSYYTVPSTATVKTTQTILASAAATGFGQTAAVSTVTTTDTNFYRFDTVALFAPMFQLIHKASDLPESSESAGSTSAKTDAETTSAGTGVSSTGSSDGLSGSSSSSQLSSGAIAGIAIASVVIGLVLIGALVYFFFRQRKAKQQIAYASPPHQDSAHTPMAAYGVQGSSYFGTLSTPMSMKSGAVQTTQVFEAPAELPRHEMP